MKLQAVKQDKQPGYPSLRDHSTRRESLLKTVLGGLLTVLAAGCNLVPQRTAGVMPPPGLPKEQAPSVNTPTQVTNNLELTPPVMLDGDVAFPMATEPENAPPAVKGRMMAPRDPKH
jgi:hypothetical protein